MGSGFKVRRQTNKETNMVRIKRGFAAHKRRKHVLKYTKGFLWGRKSKYRLAKEAMMHAWTHAYKDRKIKKRQFRQLWQTRINAVCRKHGLTYSQFIHLLKEKKIGLDRKILADLAQNYPGVFEKVIETVEE